MTAERRRLLEPRLVDVDADLVLQPGGPLRLRASHCATCDRWEFPPLEYCPLCPSSVTAGRLSPVGRVSGVTAVLHAPPDVAIDVPYTVALVDFPEGLSVLGTVPGAALEQVPLGARVTTVATEVGPDISYGFQICEDPDV